MPSSAVGNFDLHFRAVKHGAVVVSGRPVQQYPEAALNATIKYRADSPHKRGHARGRKPVTNLTPASDYAFSLIELRLNGKLEGEGKSSVTGKVTVDSSVNSIALDDDASLPVTLKNVKSRSAN